jgi:hypothetical protein
MLFFTFSTTQEYYSMPIYPALAILLGSAMALNDTWLKSAGVLSITLAVILLTILAKAWSLPTLGDIYSALSQHPDFYTLSLGHMADLTLPAFAYLRLPLALAGIALLAGGFAALFLRRQSAYIALALMLAVFFQAARLALITFDPYLSSHAVAERLTQLPKGTLIICGKYNPLSSLFFYSEDKTLQNDADLDILEYGSLAPGAPKITISDSEMKQLWNSRQRVYIVAKAPKLPHLRTILGPSLTPAFQSADKLLFIQSQ